MSVHADRPHTIDAVDNGISRQRYKFSSPGTAAESKRRESAPTAPPHRPRGRLLIALLMFGACAFGIFTVWDSFVRYKAYGVVVGRTIDVSSAISGEVSLESAYPGAVVEKNATLARVSNLEIDNQIQSVADELKIAEAKLQAESARIRWQTHVQETETTRAIAEFFATRSRLADVNGQLNVLKDQVEVEQILDQHSTIARRNLQQNILRQQAQAARLEEIRNEMNVLQTRAKKAQDAPRLSSEQIQPLELTCEKLRSELERLNAIRDQGAVRSPVNGRILWADRFTGERISENEPMFRILEESTLEVELFVPQSMTLRYQVGDTIELRIEPFGENIDCRVTAVGSEHRVPPEQIQRFYNKSTKLLPIRAIPARRYRNVRQLPIGAVARLPKRFF